MIRTVRPAALSAALAAAALFAGACGDDHAGHDHAGHDHDHDHGHDHGDAGHLHKAPHGGTLVVLGEVANLELLLDPAAGQITAWIVDGCAENAIRLAQPAIELRVGKDAAAFDVTLAATENALTGEKTGDSSQFGGSAPGLKGLARFDGVVKSVTVKGQTFKDVAFRYPEGNE